MEQVAYFLGLFHIVLCSLWILYTKESINWYKSLFQNYQLKYLAALPAIYGLLFLLAANAICYPWIFRAIAAISFFEALLAFINPNNYYGQITSWCFENIPVRLQQIFGIFGIIFGTLILTWIQ
jgi:hypothetical protein